MKRIVNHVLFTIIIASLLLTACNSPNPIPATETQKQVTQSTQVLATIAPPTNTQLPTDTPLPTETFAPTQPPAPTDTPTPVATLVNTPTNVLTGPTAYVYENTNCRSGPSSDYPVIVVIMNGQDVKIVSRTTLDSYLIVEDPTNPPQSCWLWTQYVSTSDDLSSLPVATPPPPLMSYSMVFTKIETCATYSMEFKVTNTGSKTLQSYTIVAKDLSEHTQQTSSSTVFNLRKECAVDEEIGFVDPGQVGYAYANNFTYNPSGHSMEATITICSHDDQTGICATRVVKFTP
jgi:uncharacterized protein YgiM (DUF1202 family)